MSEQLTLEQMLDKHPRPWSVDGSPEELIIVDALNEYVYPDTTEAIVALVNQAHPNNTPEQDERVKSWNDWLKQHRRYR